MNIQVIDFPSDVLGETYNVRAELTKCLQRASVSDSGAQALREILGFAVKQLKKADGVRATAAELRKAKVATLALNAASEARLTEFLGGK